jgi:hypothetical protein
MWKNFKYVLVILALVVVLTLYQHYLILTSSITRGGKHDVEKL